MSVLGTIHVILMQTVLILMVVTGVSVCQDSLEMDTSVQVIFLISTVSVDKLSLYTQISMSVRM